MPTDFEAVKQRLRQTDDEFRQLADKHHELDIRLHELSHKHYLTDQEQFEEATLKKRKLALKDRMEDIVRRYRSVGDGESAASSSASQASHG